MGPGGLLHFCIISYEETRPNRVRYFQFLNCLYLQRKSAYWCSVGAPTYPTALDPYSPGRNGSGIA